MSQRTAAIEARDYLIDRPEEGMFFVLPDVYTDPAIFALEQELIFKKSWIFLTLESEVPEPHDFITAQIASTPLILSRDRSGELRGFVNACRHKGSLVCLKAKGNARAHVCPYHAWTYDSGGKLIGMRERASAGFTPAFDALDHDLVALPRLESYRGFVFGSLSAEGPSLAAFLGDMRFFIDLLVDRYPEGLEIVPGSTSYSYRGNWKLQLENGMDAYHLETAHKTFIDIVKRRKAGESSSNVKPVSIWTRYNQMRQGIFSFEGGHTVLWTDGQPAQADRPEDVAAEKARARVGDLKADWMRKGRICTFFPNMQIQDIQSLMIRVFRPVSVDETEMLTYCLAPIGESDEMRGWRLRQYEDFFNVAGLATPDDSVIYEWCQEGFNAVGMQPLQGYTRGLMHNRSGADEMARELGLSPVMCSSGPANTYDETGPVFPFREWSRLLQPGSSGPALREAAE